MMVGATALSTIPIITCALCLLFSWKTRRKMMGMRLWIGTAMLLWPAFSLKAQEAEQCAIKPTCASMGYAQTVTACNGKKMLKCPFDSATVFCGGDACTADYTLNSCDTSKGTCAECGGKYKYTKCSGNYTLSGSVCVCHPDFSLTSCNTSVGPCEKCGSKYRYTSCNLSLIHISEPTRPY